MKIIFIRHGATSGNLEKRYIGRTDEPLCEAGIAEIKGEKYPAADVVISSPMKRCIETAKIIYPDKKPHIFDELRECDFGDFEGKNYEELNGNADYQKWVDSGGTERFPNGEIPHDFIQRCCGGFLRAVNIFESAGSLAFTIHGGTIMSFFYKFSAPQKGYYDYYVKNGCGYIAEWDGTNLNIISEIL